MKNALFILFLFVIPVWGTAQGGGFVYETQAEKNAALNHFKDQMNQTKDYRHIEQYRKINDNARKAYNHILKTPVRGQPGSQNYSNPQAQQLTHEFQKGLENLLKSYQDMARLMEEIEKAKQADNEHYQQELSKNLQELANKNYEAMNDLANLTDEIDYFENSQEDQQHENLNQVADQQASSLTDGFEDQFTPNAGQGDGTVGGSDSGGFTDGSEAMAQELNGGDVADSSAGVENGEEVPPGTETPELSDQGAGEELMGEDSLASNESGDVPDNMLDDGSTPMEDADMATEQSDALEGDLNKDGELNSLDDLAAGETDLAEKVEEELQDYQKKGHKKHLEEGNYLPPGGFKSTNSQYTQNPQLQPDSVDDTVSSRPSDVNPLSIQQTLRGKGWRQGTRLDGGKYLYKIGKDGETLIYSTPEPRKSLYDSVHGDE